MVALAVLLPSHVPAVLPAGEYAAALQLRVVWASQGLVTVQVGHPFCKQGEKEHGTSS